MSAFDRYLERLRERAGLALSPEAERELRAHFEEAVAAHRAQGRSELDAELEALGELGRPEVVAAAFRRERRHLRRLAGGPGALGLDLARSWRTLLVSALLAGALGGAVGRVLPPTYEVRVPLAVAIPMDFGSRLAARQVFDAMAGRLPISSQDRGFAIDVRDHDRQAALRRADAALEEVSWRFPTAFYQTTVASAEATVVPMPPSVVVHRPIAPATVGGLGLGLVVGGTLAARRRRR